MFFWRIGKMPFILTKNTSGRRVVWKNALNYVHCIFLYIHTIHSSISVHLGPSPSPHCLGAQREKNIPGVPSRELNLGLHLPTELRHIRTLICILTRIPTTQYMQSFLACTAFSRLIIRISVQNSRFTESSRSKLPRVQNHRLVY